MYTDKRIGSFGKTAEDMVAKYLSQNGFIIIKRNYHNRFGEIDIICEDNDNIVFVEVKARSGDCYVSGVEAVDSYKIKRIINVANYFSSRFNTKKPMRFDVAEVTSYFDEKDNEKFKLNYIKSAYNG